MSGPRNPRIANQHSRAGGRSRRPLPLRSAAAAPRSSDDPVVHYLDSYRPRGMAEERWTKAVRPLVVEQILRLNIGLKAAKRLTRVLTKITSWCVDEGIRLDIESVLDPDAVERYCNEAVGGSPSSVATVRSELRRLGRALTAKAPWEQPAPAYVRTKLSRPYSESELALIDRDLARQSTPSRIYSARVMFDLGLGAGLDGRWNTKIRGSDVRSDGDDVLISVPPPAPRTVVVRSSFSTAILECARAAGDGPLVGRSVNHKNSANFIARAVVIDGGRIQFEPGRLRSNWLVAHLEARTQIGTLMEAAGLSTVWWLRDLRSFVRPLLESDARRQLREA